MKTKYRPAKGREGPYGLDAPLVRKTGVDYEADSILELVEKFNQQTRKGRGHAFSKALLNERLFHGMQEEQGFDAGRARTLNYFTNLVLTAASRLQEDRPYIKGFPTHQEDRDVAKYVDAYFGHLFRSNNIDSLNMECTLYCLLHSQTYIRVTWDTSAGSHIKEPSRDPVSGQPLIMPNGRPIEEDLGPAGEVMWERFSIFDCSYSGENPQDSEWCTLSKWVSEDEARQLMRDMGFGDSSLESVNLVKKRPELVFDSPQDMVEVQEVWVKPGGTLKEGLFAKIVGGNVAQHMPFPYHHGKIPVLAWKYTPMVNSRWATSPADHAASLQQYINDLQEMKLELVYRTATHTKMVAIKGIAEFMGEDNAVIEAQSLPEVTQGAHWISPPDPPQILFGEQKEAISQMHEVFGLNEMLSGRANTKAGTSARAIAYLQKQDSQKHAPAMRNFERFLEEAVRQSLALFIQYAKLPRQIQVLGEGSEMYIEEIRGMDLEGADFIIEPSSGIERFRAQQEAEVERDLRMGIAEPGPGIKDRIDTGFSEDFDTYSKLSAAKKAVHDAAQGHGVKVPPGVPPNILKAELEKAKVRYDFNTNAGLQQLEQMILQTSSGPPPGEPPPRRPPQ